MRFYLLTLGVLAVWRLGHLLAEEDGPWDLVLRLRRAAGDGFWGGLLDCFYCLSVWIAAPLAVALGAMLEAGWGETLLLWPALSGGACLLQRATAPAEPAFQAVEYHEEAPPAATPGAGTGEPPEPPALPLQGTPDDDGEETEDVLRPPPDHLPPHPR